MKKALAYFIVTLFIFGCNNKDNKTADNDLPDCLNKQIEAIKNKTEKFSPIGIDEYQYKGKRVFLFKADCCDQYDMVLDENCKSICAPSGGIDGMGDGRCKDFDSTAKRVRTIWKKEDK